MTTFHNPYHFVPVSGGSQLGFVPRDKKGWPPHLDHGRFVSSTSVLENGAEGSQTVFCGRIVCKLTVEELLAIGGKQTPGSKSKPARARNVELFKINGRDALPGSSLRGMLSALAEAASNSTLRVLDDTAMQVSTGYNRNTRSVGKRGIGSVWDWFRARGLHLVPLQHGDERTHLTIAEQLFGYIEEPSANKQPTIRVSQNLGSRLRISNALAWPGECPKAVAPRTTKILSSPRPPSPALYLTSTKENGGFVAKKDVSLRNSHIQGRKFYLHREKLTESDWTTEAPNTADAPDESLHQKAIVAPLESGTFWFHLDFDNLSQLELELVCYVLRPTPAFRHKLGMGKPLGLGKVCITPVGIFLIDRLARYGVDGLAQPRYANVSRSETEAEEWPEFYHREKSAVACGTGSLATLRKGYRNRANSTPGLSDVLRAIELIGEPGSINAPVHYPQIAGVDGAKMETEHFKWWMENEVQAGQFLRPLTKDNTGGFRQLPTLSRNAYPDPPNPAPIRIEVGVRASDEADWKGPIECRFVKRAMGSNRPIFAKPRESGEAKSAEGELVMTSDMSRLPKTLMPGTRVTLMFTINLDGKLLFDLPPPHE